MVDIFINTACDAALQKLAKGDMDSLCVIYEKLGRRIFMLSLSILRDKEAAEDIMQETFLKIATESHCYEPGTNAAAFILTVARNLSLNLLAKRRRELAAQGSLDEARELADFSGVTLPKRVGELDALSLLDDDERQIVVMKLDAGMKHKDIAKLLGIEESACQKRYRRALQKLKKYYKEGD